MSELARAEVKAHLHSAFHATEGEGKVSLCDHNAARAWVTLHASISSFARDCEGVQRQKVQALVLQTKDNLLYGIASPIDIGRFTSDQTMSTRNHLLQPSRGSSSHVPTYPAVWTRAAQLSHCGSSAACGGGVPMPSCSRRRQAVARCSCLRYRGAVVK